MLGHGADVVAAPGPGAGDGELDQSVRPPVRLRASTITSSTAGAFPGGPGRRGHASRIGGRVVGRQQLELDGALPVPLRGRRVAKDARLLARAAGVRAPYFSRAPRACPRPRRVVGAERAEGDLLEPLRPGRAASTAWFQAAPTAPRPGPRSTLASTTRLLVGREIGAGAVQAANGAAAAAQGEEDAQQEDARYAWCRAA